MTRLSVCCLAILLVAMAATTASPLSSESDRYTAACKLVLPPMMTRPVEYRLQQRDGCFRWYRFSASRIQPFLTRIFALLVFWKFCRSWDRHDILSVIPEYKASSDCSTSALVRSVAPYSGRMETAVHANNTKTGEETRYEVLVDKFSRIGIFRNYGTLDVGDIVKLQVLAYDDDGMLC